MTYSTAHRTTASMEQELLDEIRRFRKELNTAMENLDARETDRRSFRDGARETSKELAMLREELAKLQAKQEQCGCGCCTESARVYADLQVRSPP